MSITIDSLKRQAVPLDRLLPPAKIKLDMAEEFHIFAVNSAAKMLMEKNSKGRPFLRKTTVQALELVAALLDTDLTDPMDVTEQAPF